MLQPPRASGINAFRPAKNNRNLCHRLVALTGMLSLLLAPAAQAQFATPGQFDVSPTGAASYTVPIAVPPGTAGMAPSLALSYNSQGGNGLLGMGWSLSGLSAITRCPKTLVQDGIKDGITYTNADKYCLDGQRLVVSNGGAYGANGTEYRTEREGFSKVVSYGAIGTTGPAWFKVWTKSGQILEFGNTADSAIEAQGKTAIRVWAVNKVSDTKGNYLTVSYTEDTPNGQYCPSRIDYTGNAAAGLVPYNSVRFVYATRPDITPMYDGGSLMKTTVRLTNVQTYAKVDNADTLVKDYRLAYDVSAATQRSQISQVQECDTSGNCYGASSVVYEARGNAGVSTPQYTPPITLEVNHAGVGNDHHNGAKFIDLNGDGFLDLVQSIYAVGTIYSGAWINTGSAWVSASQHAPPVTLEVVHGNVDLNHGNGVQFIDLNGDGRLDMVQRIKAFGVVDSHAWLNTTSGWASAPQYAPPVDLEVMTGNANTNHHNGTKFVDLNGDGLPDLVQGIYLLGTNYYGAWLNTGNGWVAATQYNPPVQLEVMHGDANINHKDGVEFIDLNGDGRIDIVQRIQTYGTSTYSGAWLNTPTGWVSAPQFIPPVDMEVMNGTAPYNHHNGTRFVDINGDGLPDLVRSIYAVGTVYSGAWINTGAGISTGSAWVSASQHAPPVTLEVVHGNVDLNHGNGVQFIDLNGDGRLDMVQRIKAFGVVDSHAWLNTTSGWVSALQYAPPVDLEVMTGNANTNHHNGVQLVDINGDGGVDYVQSTYDVGTNSSGAWVNQKGVSDFLVSITNGLGAATGITYKPLTDSTVYTKDTAGVYPYVDLQAPLYVVSSVSSSDGIGGNYNSNYTYVGAKSHLTGGGFLGFRQTISTDAQTGIKSTTTYRQDYPYQGLPLAAEKRTSTNVLLNSVTNTWAFNTNPAWGAQYHVPQLTQSAESSYELTGTLISTVTTCTKYEDDYGNPTYIGVWTNTTAAGINCAAPPAKAGLYVKETINQYTNDIVNWYLGRLTSATVISTTP